MADRVMTWSLATLFRSGAYNSTFDFNVLEPAYNLVCQYFRLRMPRQRSGGSFRVIQANINKNNWAAWTTGSTIYISPTFRFGNDRRRCAKVAVHEFGHIGNGTSHSHNPEALMSADGGTSQGWVQDDLRWFGRYGLRGAMPPRGIFATVFGGAVATALDGKFPGSVMDGYVIDGGNPIPVSNGVKWTVEEGTPLGVANGVWDRFRDYFRVVHPMVEGVYCD